MSKKWLCGKTAIVTGASGGIGAKVSELLIKKYGCKIIGVARNEERLKKIKAELGDKFDYRIFDVSVRENWEKFAAELSAENVIPDILINNAGFMLPFKKFEDLSFSEIDEIVATDFVSCLNSVKFLMPLLKKSSSPAIINVSSSAGLCAVVGESMYCAVKFAVRGFTETLIQEYKKQIYVAGVYPGFIRTEILKDVRNRQRKQAHQQVYDAGRKSGEKNSERHCPQKKAHGNGRGRAVYEFLFPPYAGRNAFYRRQGTESLRIRTVFGRILKENL